MKTAFPSRLLHRILTLVLFAGGIAWLPLNAQAQTFKVLYSFTGGADGGVPQAGVVFDAAGNLYGTTVEGGDSGCFGGTCGVVFELTPGSGGWSESLLHTFTGGSDGGNPTDGLVFDAAGNLYGTAQVGGTSCGQEFGCGVAFELIPGSGGWTETVLHSFLASEGYYPIAALVFDKHGQLYSTLPGDGSGGSGTVYQLTKGTSGWTEKTLHNFRKASDGSEPEAALILDASGNLYGTTPGGGNENGGMVFELLHGSWKERILYQFKCGIGCNKDAGGPFAGLVFDKAGNLYGTTRWGGKYKRGAVFKLAPSKGGEWMETVLYSFNGLDGAQPFSTLILDKAGNLYGTTELGGSFGCAGAGCGTIFELKRTLGGRWKERVLHRFTGGSDGSAPFYETLIFDEAGNLYGTAALGGNAGCSANLGCGVVFEITP